VHVRRRSLLQCFHEAVHSGVTVHLFAQQNAFAGYGFSVDLLIRIAVNRDHRAVERDSRKQPFAPRIGEDSRFQENVGAYFRLATNRSGTGRSVRPEFTCPLAQTLDAGLVREYQHHIAGLHANLQAKAASTDLNKGRRAPAAVFRALGH